MNGHQIYGEMLARRGELSPIDEARLRRHLAECAECRRTAEAYARQTALLRSIPAVEPPPALRAGVLDQVRRRKPARMPIWRRPAMVIFPLAAALVVAIVGYSELHPFGGSNRAASAPTQAPLSATPRFIPGGGKRHPTFSVAEPAHVHKQASHVHAVRRPAQVTNGPAYAPSGPSVQLPASPLVPSIPNPSQPAAPPRVIPTPTPAAGPSAGTDLAIGAPPTTSSGGVTAGGAGKSTAPPAQSAAKAAGPAASVAPAAPHVVPLPTAPAPVPPTVSTPLPPTPAPAPTGSPVVSFAPIRPPSTGTATPPPTPTSAPPSPAPALAAPAGTATPTPTPTATPTP